MARGLSDKIGLIRGLSEKISFERKFRFMRKIVFERKISFERFERKISLNRGLSAFRHVGKMFERC